MHQLAKEMKTMTKWHASNSFAANSRRLFIKMIIVSCAMASCSYIAKNKHELLPAPSPRFNHRRLDWASNCPADLISTLPYPTSPNVPFLKRPAYLASFPGSGDKLFSKYLVEMISGLEVGEAAISPSLHKIKELGGTSGGNGGQGEVFGVRTHFPHTSGKLVSF
jgi:hypothetical protein